MRFFAGQRAQPALPAKAVGDQYETVLVGEIAEIANRDQRVLQTGRQHREIVGVLGPQF